MRYITAGRTNIEKGLATIWIMLAIAMVALAVGAAGSYWYVKQTGTQPQPSSVTPPSATPGEPSPPTPPGQATNYSTTDYEYKLDTTFHERDASYDQKLIRRNRQTGKEEVIVQDALKALPDFEGRGILDVFAHPDDATVVILKTILPDTDNPAGQLYSFDTQTIKFTKMKVNAVYNGFFGGFAKAPDETQFVWAPLPDKDNVPAQMMYLVNLLNDSSKELVSLKGNESFNGGSWALGAHYEVEWSTYKRTEKKVRYAVYDYPQRFKDPNTGNEQSQYIEHREVTVQ